MHLTPPTLSYAYAAAEMLKPELEARGLQTSLSIADRGDQGHAAVFYWPDDDGQTHFLQLITAPGLHALGPRGAAVALVREVEDALRDLDQALGRNAGASVIEPIE